MSELKRITVIIPAYNEQDSVAVVVERLRSANAPGCHLQKIIVVDNGSSDATRQRAESAGAMVVTEWRRGYGCACLRGISEIDDTDIVLFIDADGSDMPEEWPTLVRSLVAGDADLVIGSRVLGNRQKGALMAHARFGNLLATTLLRRLPLGNAAPPKFSDLGPFRAITWPALRRISMVDKDYGWTVEMQLKAVTHNLRCEEVPVSYRKRIAGKSKIAGTLSGSMRAGIKILFVICREAFKKRLTN